MKKFLAVLLAAVMICISFVACSSETKTEETGNDTQQATLTMATNAEFPPYEYKEGDQVVGIDAEIAQAIADELGMKLEIVDTKFDAIIPGVQSGKYDMGMAGMTVTPEREQSVSFSNSYATGIQSIIVKEGSDIKSSADLAGKVVAVQLGTSGESLLSGDLSDLSATFKDLVTCNSFLVCFTELGGGSVDAVLVDYPVAAAYVEENEGFTIIFSTLATPLPCLPSLPSSPFLTRSSVLSSTASHSAPAIRSSATRSRAPLMSSLKTALTPRSLQSTPTSQTTLFS